MAVDERQPDRKVQPLTFDALARAAGIEGTVTAIEADHLRNLLYVVYQPWPRLVNEGATAPTAAILTSEDIEEAGARSRDGDGIASRTYTQ